MLPETAQEERPFQGIEHKTKRGKPFGSLNEKMKKKQTLSTGGKQ